jgi:DNA-binding NtrC family response regulator
MSKPTIVIADRDEGRRRSIADPLRAHGHDVLEASTRSELWPGLNERGPDLVIVGSSRDESRETLDLIREVRRIDPALPIILVTEHSTEELAIAALRAGVTDYVKLPMAPGELTESVTRHLIDVARGLVVPVPAPSGSDVAAAARMIGESRAMRALRARIAKVGPSDSGVLITGETGTGKELGAHLLHESSGRRHRPLVTINCAAIPDSLLESELFGYERGAFTGAHAAYDGKLKLADGGTVFFDEIGDMSPYAQAKVLRVIETKEAYRLGGTKCVPLDFRVIAATNQDLEPLVACGRFRKDLFFRLNVVRIHLLPLRQRRQDIPQLIEHCIRDLNTRRGVAITGVAAAAMDALTGYDWPGNVRELRNVLEAMTIERPSGKIFLTKLPEHVRRGSRGETATPNAVGSDERDRVLSALSSTNWNKWKAAERLHWSRMTLYRKIAKYQISRAGPVETSSRDL